MGLGVPAVLTLLGSSIKEVWTKLFLWAAFITTVTGFLFPLTGMTPAVAIGLITTLLFVAIAVARVGFNREGRWKLVYDMGIFMNVYFLVFVAIAQAFLKIPALYDLAPTQAEPPFTIAQIIAFGIFVQLGKRVVRVSKNS